MDKYKKLTKNTIIFAIGTFSSKVLSFLLMPFITRVMATGDYSTADLVQQTVNVLIPIVFLQVNSACLRFALDKAYDKSDVLTVGVRTTLIGFAVFLLFAYPMKMVNINDFALGNYVVLIYAFLLVSGFRQLCQQFVRGSNHVKTFAIDGIIATATNLSFVLLFIGVFKWGVNGYILAIIVSDACSVIFLSITQKLWKNIKFKGVKRSTAVEMLKYSIPMMPTIILWWVINVSDRYMVTYFVGSSVNGLYTAASKIPSFLIIFSTIFMDAWQLSAVDEYESDDRSDFFTNVFRVYSGGIFTASSGLILACQLITKILVSKSFFESWKFVPILIVATSVSCLVIFLASIYMAEKKNFMAMVTALLGAGANIVLNFVLIPRFGAIGAAISTVISFVVVYITRLPSIKGFLKFTINTPIILCEMAILIAQCFVMIHLERGLQMYAVEVALFAVMFIINLKPIRALAALILGKFGRKEQ